jgi:hypothetical protein
MNFNNLIFALLFFFCVGINSLNFPGSVDGRIRRCLLEGLKRLHTNSAPLKTPILNDSKDSTILSNYPVELKQVFLGNLDFKSIKKLSQCNKKAAHLTVPAIAQRLASFNPHFAFDDELVNSLLLAVLDKHFPKSKNLQSETIHDELQLFILKYSRDDLNFDSIPKNIYFYLILFINEAVHGVDAIFDSSIQHFCILLLKFKIPESCSYFRQFFADDFFDHSLDKSWENHLDFFSQNPSKEEIRNYFEIPADINDWIKPKAMHYLFYDAVLELFYDEFTDENVVDLYDHMIAWHLQEDCFSLKDFNRRYYSIIDEDELMWAYNNPYPFSSHLLAIVCNELSVRFGISINTCYFSSRNSLNELSLDRLASFNSETILKQLTRYPVNRIYDFEFLVTLMNSELISPKLRLQILTCFIKCFTNDDDIYDFVYLLMKETTQPINYIEYDHNDNKYLTFLNLIFDNFHNYSSLLRIEKVILEFANSVNDPLICLMILVSEFSPEASRIVQQKDLDLNKVYRFDYDLDMWIGSCNYAGLTIHFKQILKELDNPKLNEAFNLDSNDLNRNYSRIDKYLPVVSFDKNFTFTLNSKNI